MASRGGAADGAPLSLATDGAEVAAAAGGPAALAPATAAPEQQRRRISVSSEISEQGACCQYCAIASCASTLRRECASGTRCMCATDAANPEYICAHAGVDHVLRY